MFRNLILMGCSVVMTGCAVAVVDYPRQLNFEWDLEPETIALQSLQAEQGQIFFEWTARARASHKMTRNNEDVLLMKAPTRYGTLYCAAKDDGDQCFEDRDGDGQLDYVWGVGRVSHLEDTYLSASQPEALERTLPFEALGEPGETLAEQKLGLLYDGPMRGKIDDNGEFEVMLGEVSVGWHDGKDAPRNPNGGGWQQVNALGIVVFKDRDLDIRIENFGLDLTTRGGTMVGTVALDVAGEPVDGLNVRDRPDVDIPERAVNDLDLEEDAI